MARFGAITSTIEGNEVRVQFPIGAPCVLGWRIYDPETGAFLFEGEWSQVRDAVADLRVTLPPEDGPYRVQIAPVEDPARFILIEARVRDGELGIAPPRVCSAGSLRRERFFRAVPKAFTYPPRSLWRHRKLIRSMVRRDMLARYRGSFAGALWTFLNPLLLMATYAFIFGAVLKTRFGNDSSGIGYVLYFLAGMLPWLAFSEAIGRAPSIILEYRNFAKKLVFPLDTLPVNLVIAGLVTELFGLLIFLIGLLAARHSVPSSVVWLPVLIVPQLLLTAGLCWFLAALGIFVRDLSAVMGFLLTLWFFLTPICYSEEMLPLAARPILSLNPIFVLVRGYRKVFLQDHAPDFTALAVLWIASAVVAILGYAWFHRLRRSFADVI